MSCRDCWDPAPEGQDLCDYCSMTPAQRRRAAVLHAAIAVGGLFAYGVLMWWLAGAQ